MMGAPVTKTDCNGAFGCWSASMTRGIMPAAVIAAFATCVLSFRPAFSLNLIPLGSY